MTAIFLRRAEWLIESSRVQTLWSKISKNDLLGAQPTLPERGKGA